MKEAETGDILIGKVTIGDIHNKYLSSDSTLLPTPPSVKRRSSCPYPRRWPHLQVGPPPDTGVARHPLAPSRPVPALRGTGRPAGRKHLMWRIQAMAALSAVASIRKPTSSARIAGTSWKWSSSGKSNGQPTPPQTPSHDTPVRQPSEVPPSPAFLTSTSHLCGSASISGPILRKSDLHDK